MRRKKLLSIILSITLVLSMCASFSTLYHGRMEEDVWDKTGALDEAPIVTAAENEQSYCNKCGCNLDDAIMFHVYNDYGYYILDGGCEEYNDLEGDYITNITWHEHIDPSTGKKTDHELPGFSNYQVKDNLPNHTYSEIGKIYPKFQITCDNPSHHPNIWGDILGLVYTGKEQHPVCRVISNNKIISNDNYTIFYKNVNDYGYYKSSLDYSAGKSYYRSDSVPDSDPCIEEGKYAAVCRFKTNSEFRGQLICYFEIKKYTPPAPDPSPTSGYVSSEKLKAEVNKSTKLSDEDKEYMCECIDIGKTKDGLTKIKSFVDSEWYLPSGDTITSAFLQSLVDAALGTDNTSEEKTTEKKEETTGGGGDNGNKDEGTTEKQVTTEKQPNTQTPTVTTTSTTETQVTTRQKIVKGDIFRSKTAQYTVTGTNTISFDTPLKRTKKVTVPATVKVNKKTYKVTSVKSKAFKGNTKLTTLVVGSNVKTLGSNCCNGCINLKKITVNSKKLETIGAGAFKGCVKLKVAKFKSTKLKTLNTGAFRNCSKLTTVEIKSKKLVKVGTYAFDGCGKLKNITIKSSKVKFYKGSFRKISKKATFKVPKRKVKAYAKSVVKKGKAPKTVSVK